MHDVVYIYKKKNEDTLRFSLRSLSNVPHGNVFIVGDLPSWTKNVFHIPYMFGKGRILDSWSQIKLACQDPRLSEDFIFMNDDFYIMHPVNTIPYYVRNKDKRGNSVHGKALARTRALFPAHEFKCFDSVHSPMVINTKKFLSLYEVYDINGSYVYKTLYGNHYKLEAIVSHDVKTRSITSFLTRFKRNDYPFMSSDDQVERDSRFKAEMSRFFSEKSIYEV